MTYIVISENPISVNIFKKEGDELPWLYQPHYPNGDEWESVEEAQSWSETFLESLSEDCDLNPQIGRNIERTKKVLPENK